ncbi:MAG: CBS domain-containing protein, partial [Deltaproteobacteria bacterium]
MNNKNVGFVLVIDKKEIAVGILTDGDIRRHISKGTKINEKKIDDIMSCSPKTINNNASIADAIAKMQQLEITTLVVVNGKNKLLGYIHLHDVLGRGGSLRISLPV